MTASAATPERTANGPGAGLGRRIPRLASRRRAGYAAGEASNALTLALFALLARSLGVEPYGELVTIVAVSAILGTGVEFGFHTLLTRTVAREPARAARGLLEAHRRQILLAPTLLAGMWAYLSLAGLSPTARTAGLLIGASTAVRALKETIRGACRGLERFGLEAAFLWTERGTLLAASAAVLALGGGLVEVGATFLAVRTLDFLAFLAAFRRAAPRAPGPTHHPATGWRAVLPFAVGNALWALYAQLDPALVAALATPHDAGIYGAAYRFVDIVQLAPRLAIVVTFPTMAVTWTADRDRFRRGVAGLRAALAAIGFPALCIPLLGGPWLLRHGFGEEYAAGSTTLAVLMVGSLFAFQSMILIQALQAAGQERGMARAFGLTVAAKLVGNLALTPRWGHLGAATAAALTELTVLALLARLFRRADPATAAAVFPARDLTAAAALGAAALLVARGAPLAATLAAAAGWALLLRRAGAHAWAHARQL